MAAATVAAPAPSATIFARSASIFTDSAMRGTETTSGCCNDSSWASAHIDGNTLLPLMPSTKFACGTIVESQGGTEVAARTVYGAAWFKVLLAAFAVNVAASIFLRWPFGRARVGFVLTHAALLLILVGAVITELFKVEGRLPLWEGERTGVFATRDGASVALPFDLTLEAFEIDTYPGTSGGSAASLAPARATPHK